MGELPVGVEPSVVTWMAAPAVAEVMVTDWALALEHRLLNEWKDTIVRVLGEEADQIQRMARRLSAFTTLAKFVAADTPLWRIGGIGDALATTDAYMNALSNGDAAGAAYVATARPRGVAADRDVPDVDLAALAAGVFLAVTHRQMTVTGRCGWVKAAGTGIPVI